jgi:hypothetical protein
LVLAGQARADLTPPSQGNDGNDAAKPTPPKPAKERHGKANGAPDKRKGRQEPLRRLGEYGVRVVAPSGMLVDVLHTHGPGDPCKA